MKFEHILLCAYWPFTLIFKIVHFDLFIYWLNYYLGKYNFEFLDYQSPVGKMNSWGRFHSVLWVSFSSLQLHPLHYRAFVINPVLLVSFCVFPGHWCGIQENIGYAYTLKWFPLRVAKSQVLKSLIHLQVIFEQSKRQYVLFPSRWRVPGMKCRLCTTLICLSSSSRSLAGAVSSWFPVPVFCISSVLLFASLPSFIESQMWNLWFTISPCLAFFSY